MLENNTAEPVPIMDGTITNTSSSRSSNNNSNNNTSLLSYNNNSNHKNTNVSTFSDESSKSSSSSSTFNINNNNNNSNNTIIAPPPATATNTTISSSNSSSKKKNSTGGYYIKWSRIEKRVSLKTKNQNTVSGFFRNSTATTNKSFGRSSSSIYNSLFRSSTNVDSTAVVENRNHQSANNNNANNTKDILKGISGYAAPGEVLALMGPSGSGKTSLLNVLSGRSHFQGGFISINNERITSNNNNNNNHSSSFTNNNTTNNNNNNNNTNANNKLMKRLKSQIAYVKQADVFFEHLTVRDQFIYTALLRLQNDLSYGEKVQAAENMMERLRLTKVKSNPIQMCSGGEKKRINIGCEIVSNPAVIILDEPTSGLDSTSAVSLMKLLSVFAKQYGKTVITSIHQPSSGVFFSFDQLLILSEGYVVYFGTPSDSLSYLKIQQNLPCPDGYNAADHWMDLLVINDMNNNNNNITDNNNNSITANNNNISSRQQLEQAWDDDNVAEQIMGNMNDTMKSSQHSSNNDNNNNNGGGGGVAQLDMISSKYNTDWSTQYYVLTSRAFKNSQSAIFTPINLIKSVAMGIISGLLWFQIEYTEQNLNDIRSYYFFTMTYWVFDAMFGALTSFPQERTVILKERSSGSYHLSAYFMAKTTADAPVRLNLPLIYMIISFWMAGISNSFITFIGTTGCTLLSVLAGEAIGLFVGAAIYDLQKAITTMTVFVLFLTLVGGFFVENIPSFLLWAQYVSPFKYAFDSSLQLVFNKPMPCDGSGALEELCLQNNQEYVSVADLHDFMGIQGSVGFNVGILVIICFVPRYWAYLALRSKKETER